MHKTKAVKVQRGDYITAPAIGIYKPAKVLEIQTGIPPIDPKVKYPLFLVELEPGKDSVQHFTYLHVKAHYTAEEMKSSLGTALQQWSPNVNT